MSTQTMTTTGTKESQAVATSAGTTTWQLDASHSHAQFKVRHMMISNVKGEFKTLSGTLKWNPNDLSQSSIEATIDPASIDTSDEGRNTHLKSADFFDVEQFKDITFKSTRFEKKSGDLHIVGELTMHGVTKEVVLEVEGPTGEMKDPWGDTRIALSATTKVNRKDFGLHWNTTLEAGGVLVGDDVKITLEGEFVKQQVN